MSIPIKTMVGAAALCLTSSVYAATVLPGIPPAGEPSFENSANVYFVALGPHAIFGYQMVATGAVDDMTFNNSASEYDVEHGRFLATAHINRQGEVTRGQVVITGAIPELYDDYPTDKPRGLLFSADLDNVAWDGETVGFTTSDFNGWAAQFGTDESLYFTDLSTPFPGLCTGPRSSCATFYVWNANAHAVTTVPVPAAVWLLGSGLVGLMSLGHRSVKKTAA